MCVDISLCKEDVKKGNRRFAGGSGGIEFRGGTCVHLTSHLGNTVSRLVQEQEDYIWSGIRFLKTKGCVFRLLPISPLRFCASELQMFSPGMLRGCF